MIREPEFGNEIVADIRLTSDHLIQGVDIPPDMFQQEGMICFWVDEDNLMFMPITEVKWIQIRAKSTKMAYF